MAKKRTAKKLKSDASKRRKKTKPKKRPARKPGVRVVGVGQKDELGVPQVPTLHDLFEGIKGRPPKSLEELEQWLATDEGKQATVFESTSVSRWGEVGRS